MTVEYAWKENHRYTVEAQKAGERIEKLTLGGTRNGSALRKAIVADARPVDAPLHPCFEWNDATAAEKYRENQAGDVVRALVTIEDSESGPKITRAFVSVTIDEEPHYTTIGHALDDDELRAQVVEKAWQELMQWTDRYEHYKELAKMRGLISREAEYRKSASARRSAFPQSEAALVPAE